MTIEFKDALQQQVYEAALKVLKDTSEANMMRVDVVVERIKKELGDDTLKHGQVYNKLKDSVELEGGLLSSRKGRNGGYYKVSEAAVDTSEPLTKQEAEKEKTLEKDLWPVVSDWLRSKYADHVTADLANLKGGGIWSNPDVIGINIIDDLGLFEVEIYTVEVKPSLKNWRYFFFEAVSHKRFSERVYFIYRNNGSVRDEEKNELLRYAEKYGVGVVELDLDNEEYNTIRKWKTLPEEERPKFLELFKEIIPAPFEAISVRDKVDFLRRLGIGKKQELYRFGSS